VPPGRQLERPLVLPGALNAFALVGAELAVRHDNDELMVPEILRP